MLLHVTPRLLEPLGAPLRCELIDVHVPELSLTLQGGRDVIARRPYPNRHYQVACRQVGRKAIAGLFIETPDRIEALTVSTRWAIEGEIVATHRVRYEILDQDFDAATDNMTLWYGMSSGLGGWRSRWPAFAEGWTPAAAQPRMDVLRGHRAPGQIDFTDTVGRTGVITERRETFRMPTVERERLLQRTSLTERLPALEDAFRGAPQRPEVAEDADNDHETIGIAP